MFCAAAARKNCSRTNFNPAQPQAAQPDLILEFREQGFYFFSLPLCLGKLSRVRQLPCALPGRLVLMDDQASEGRTGALRS